MEVPEGGVALPVVAVVLGVPEGVAAAHVAKAHRVAKAVRAVRAAVVARQARTKVARATRAPRFLFLTY